MATQELNNLFKLASQFAESGELQASAQHYESIEAAGKAGLPVVEYNFYAHRIIEAYYESVGRANAGYTEVDYQLEVLVNPDGSLAGPMYRDANGQLTPETLAAFPNAKKMKVKDLPPLASEGAHN